MRRRRDGGRRAGGVLATVAGCGLAALAAACGTLGGTGGPAPAEGPDFFAEGIDALDIGDWVGAEDRFRRLAARCENGDRGRRSLLLLTALELDPRNPGARPDEAARLAAAFLGLPAAPEEERVLARTLYLTALDRGGAPVRDSAGLVDPEAVEVRAAATGPLPAAYLQPARRFARCEAGPPPFSLPPEHPGTPSAEALEAARARAAKGRSVTDSLEARVKELEAELERIRKLLKGGGGGGSLRP